MTEPPGIEGYLTRVKVTTSNHQPIYLATHDGLLFTLLPSNANPPKPPGLAPQPPGSDTDNFYTALRQEEIRRGSSQVFHARNVMDFRDIVAVRRAFSPVTIAREAMEENRRPLWSDDDGPVEVERSPEDEEDVGGDEGLSRVEPGPARDHAKMRRGFELLLQTGKVIRYEVSFFIGIWGKLLTLRTPLRLILRRSPSSGSNVYGYLCATGNGDIISMLDKKWTSYTSRWVDHGSLLIASGMTRKSSHPLSLFRIPVLSYPT